MRTWLLTNTTYGTWLPGDARGSVTSVRDRRADDVDTPHRIEHDRPGEAWEPAIPGLARAAVANRKGPPILLEPKHARLLIDQFRETAEHRDWNLTAAAVMANHFHLVVSFPGDPDPRRALTDFKAYGSRVLNRAYGKPPSDTWWTTRGSVRKLPDERSIASATHYVLHKQSNPLATWSPEQTLGEPGA